MVLLALTLSVNYVVTVLIQLVIRTGLNLEEALPNHSSCNLTVGLHIASCVETP